MILKVTTRLFYNGISRSVVLFMYFRLYVSTTQSNLHMLISSKSVSLRNSVDENRNFFVVLNIIYFWRGGVLGEGRGSAILRSGSNSLILILFTDHNELQF